MTFYISIQTTDYDGYPRGSDSKIGLFDSKEAAEKWLDNCEDFYKRYYLNKKEYPNAYSWQQDHNVNTHTVSINNLLTTYMEKPEEYESWSSPRMVALRERLASQRKT